MKNFDLSIKKIKILSDEKQELQIEVIALRKRTKCLKLAIGNHETELIEQAKETETTLIIYQKDVIGKFFASLMVAKITEHTTGQVNIYCDQLASFLRMEPAEKLEFKTMLKTGKPKITLRKTINIGK